MTTVADLIDQVLKDVGVLGGDETAVGTQDATDTLAMLNQMLSLWQIGNANVYAQQVTSFVPTGAVSYTVGPTANIVMTRPEKIDQAYWRLGTLDYPLTIIPTFEQYEAIPQKTQAGDPHYLCYVPSYPTGTLYTLPQASTGTIYLVTQARLPIATTGDFAIPPEYELPVRQNLAVLMASGTFGKQLSQTYLASAAAGLRAIKRNNLRLPVLDANVPGVRSRGNIFAG